MKIPDAIYQHLKYPESFRATILQIRNEGFKAFKAAHGAMLKIYLSTSMIQDFLEDAIWLISLDEPVSIQFVIHIHVSAHCLFMPTKQVIYKSAFQMF